MPRDQRQILAVRFSRVVAIGFVAGGDGYPLHQVVMDAARLEQVVRAANIALEGLQGNALGGGDDSLRPEMNDGVGLVLVDGAFERGEVLELTRHQRDLTPGARAKKLNSP